MGREVRRVPADWVHPRSERDPERYQPQYDQTFDLAAKEWKENFLAWEAGHNACFGRPREEDEKEEYWEYNGEPPDRAYYRPDWPEESRTHLMMYESTSEGTPISPAFETPEELARWLADNGASSFANMTASYEDWLATCKAGWAPSAMVGGGRGIVSGVEGMAMGERTTAHDPSNEKQPLKDAADAIAPFNQSKAKGVK